MRRYTALLLIITLSGLALLVRWWYTSYPTHHDSVHYHAGFRVYVDGALQDYTGYQYMNYVPCSEHDKKKTPEEEQIEKAHLHDSVGDVVHVHREGATWGDLFTNIGVELPSDSVVKGYVDGVEDRDIMKAPIVAYTTAIFVVGDSDQSRGNEVVSIDHIKQVEAKSELCGS